MGRLSDGVQASDIAFMSVVGNHDLAEGPGEAAFRTYRRYLGPERYPFDIGSWHFLIRDNWMDLQQQRDWIAYLRSSEVTSGTYLIETSLGEEVASGALVRDGTWTWRASPQVTFPPEDAYEIEITVTDDKGILRSVEGSFQFGGQQGPAVGLASDWPQFGGGAARGGCSPDTVAPPFALSWVSDTHGDLDFSSPVLKQGTIYVGVGNFDELTTNHGVIALDAASGAENWFFVTDTLVRHSVAVDGSAVYAVAQGGSVYALDPVAGTEIWRAENGTSLVRWQNGAPALFGGTVYVGTPGRLAAFDSTTGAEDWGVVVNVVGDFHACAASPATDGAALMLRDSGANCQLRHHSAADGSTVRTWPASTSYSSPTISGNLVIYPTAIQCLAFDIGTGGLEWEYTFSGGYTPATTPAVSGDTVVFGSGNGQVIALDVNTGAERWVFRTGAANLVLTANALTGMSLVGAPTISGNVVYVGSADGKLYALDLAFGTELWSHDFGVPIVSAPCISGNTLFLTAYDGHVYAFTASP
ncbi:MAG TPA: PQQ-binding-like beta-propeller repeat protein [Phycisphaerae bacterium]|nr:PQQ-binding-like beta-propeller repeat protein [Phycisphaerae bacterium]